MKEVKETPFKTILAKTKAPKGFVKPKPFEEILSLDDLIYKANIFGTIVFRVGKGIYRLEKNPKFDK